MSDYGTGFLMAGVALIVSALFLMLLHQMTRRGVAQSPMKGRDSPPESDRGLEGGSWGAGENGRNNPAAVCVADTAVLPSISLCGRHCCSTQQQEGPTAGKVWPLNLTRTTKKTNGFTVAHNCSHHTSVVRVSTCCLYIDPQFGLNLSTTKQFYLEGQYFLLKTQRT